MQSAEAALAGGSELANLGGALVGWEGQGEVSKHGFLLGWLFGQRQQGWRVLWHRSLLPATCPEPLQGLERYFVQAGLDVHEQWVQLTSVSAAHNRACQNIFPLLRHEASGYSILLTSPGPHLWGESGSEFVGTAWYAWSPGLWWGLGAAAMLRSTQRSAS